MLTKLEVARRQLGAVLELFIRDQDPVSVQCLACGAGEVLQTLAQQTEGAQPFLEHILETRPELDIKEIAYIRNKFWNAFKHMATHKGETRNDAALLANFSDEQNDGALFIGWHDYHQIAGRLPLEAQVFQVWYQVLADAAGRANPAADLSAAHRAFPNLAQMPRGKQKRQLVRVIRRYKEDRKVMSDPGTETTPLIL